MRVHTSYSIAYQKLELEECDAVSKTQSDDVSEFRKKSINLEAKKGARLGFKIGSSLSIIGLPLGQCVSDMDSKSNRTSRIAKKRFPFMAIFLLPGAVVGAVGAGIGGAVGAIVGRVKASKASAVRSRC